jgi:APA family basic amino acid/polyamine antiporter
MISMHLCIGSSRTTSFSPITRIREDQHTRGGVTLHRFPTERLAQVSQGLVMGSPAPHTLPMNRRIKSIDDAISNAERHRLPRSLGSLPLMLLGIGTIIGTGIFVLTSEAAQKAGPGMMVAFIIAGFVCAVTALCYAELATMVPISGSAYTFAYVTFGEAIAWIVGWGLIAEYAVAASAVAVGWSNYLVGLLKSTFGLSIPRSLVTGPFEGGILNLPATLISLAATFLLYIGTRESARFNAALVALKVAALILFIAITIPVMKSDNFVPFAPLGIAGIGAAAASIFFAYVGFDAVSTAAEEAHNPQRTVPIGLIGSLVVCTVLYLLIAAGAIGAIGAQPILDPATGQGLATGTLELARACQLEANAQAMACSHEALPHVLREVGWQRAATFVGLAAFFALPSVILMCIYGQTRIFFAMSRDGLLPRSLCRVHDRFGTPHVVTVFTGLCVAAGAAFFPVGKLADFANAGTLLAFLIVSMGVLVLRRVEPGRVRPFRIPALTVIGPLAIVGCLYLFFSLSLFTLLVFAIWTALGSAIYLAYGHRRSPLAPR